MMDWKRQAWDSQTKVSTLSSQPHGSQAHLVHVESSKNSARNIRFVVIVVAAIGLVALAGLIVGIATLVETVEKPNEVEAEQQEATPVTSTDSSTVTPQPTEVCLTRRTTFNCSTDTCVQKYRTYDGTCNNDHFPLWGASEIPFKRLFDPIYEEGVNTPIGWNRTKTYNGFIKPSARRVSQTLMTTPNITLHENYTDLVMVWGQYFDHDTDLTPKTNSLCQENCIQKLPYCFPIFASDDDSRLGDDECISFTRSTRICDVEPREQLNSVTSYVDASTVYGSTKERALYLRDLTTDLGHLRTGISVNAYGQISKSLMPFKHEMAQACNRPTKDDTGIPCFFAGDVRANEHLGLIAIHTLWVREHNRIADELKEINPSWSGETIYQEARKIVGALHQIISFDHWLPKIVGTKGMELLGSYNDYEPLVEASTANSFATAAFRFGHAQISPTVFRLGADFNETSDGNLLLHDAAFCPFRIVNEGSIDPVLRGMFGTPLKDINPDEIMSHEVTESLFKLTSHVAFDLASLNIQRGRDHGLPGYNRWRQFCSLPTANTFDDLANEISDVEVRQNLEDLYGHPDNVDLFVAGLVEDPWYDSIVGPTFTCLITHQFRSWRTGDRFWYKKSGIFTSDQITELEKHSLARVLCDSGDDIQEIQSDIFQRATYPDGYLACDEIPSMNLNTAWMNSVNDDCTI